MARYVYHVYSFFLLFFISHHSVQSVLPSNQTATMENLYEILKNNTAQSSTFPWNRTEDPNPCSWKGVNCSVNQSSVTQISLPSLSISSPSIVSLLCQIDTLESVDLSNNLLSLIPDEFITDCGELSGLERLNFSRNILSGTLPTFVGFEMLEYLDLSHNLLNGSIGLQLDGLVSLKNLNLGFNKFSGSVPTHFGKSMVLEELDLSANQFQGKFPEEIANYSNLVKIDLSMNNISGSIPDRLQALSKLNIFVLSSNYLSGGIPRFLSSIQSLIRFAVNNNRFSGVIPAGLTMYLRHLDLSYNVLDGFIPDDLLLHSNLLTLDLSNNSLIGSIPEKMSSSLVRLRLGNNLLTGKIPSSFGSLQNLIYLELNDNALTGSIPSELGMCKLLALLNLANNSLTGGLPGQLGNLSNLQELKLQWNNLIGEIPIQITQLQKLQKLNISRNLLNGSISSVSRLQNLVYLDLSRNNLSGRIPDSIRNLDSLIELQLGMNQLSGKIPLMPQNLQIALNLSSNLFEGSIPKTLSMLGQLEVLDLSNNRLSGEIPESLASIKTLTTLELSNNLLSGVVPAFPSYIMVNTSGNKDLKHDTTVNSPVQRKRVKVVVLSVIAAVVSVAIVTIIAIFAARRYYRTNEQQIKSHEENSPSEIIHGTLLTTNSFHRSNIDFTKAMESVIDPSNVILKTKLSIYYRAIMPSGMSYLVKKLNWADKIFQSGSHNKFQEELQVLGKLSNSNIMSPLAYVLTVDSAYLFYDFAHKDTLFNILHCRKSGEALDWGSRYSIAIGVAQGLAYLHGFSSGPILLLDLSSRNIFLKSLKEPQIGDIEIFKVIDPTKSTGSLSAVAGSVGYIPPEYAYTMRVTMEGNVYSFGVILLELLTGKSAVSQGIELAKWALSNSRQQNNLDGILDFNISHTSLAVRNQMLAVLKVALACVSISTDARPKTKSITRMLLNAR